MTYQDWELSGLVLFKTQTFLDSGLSGLETLKTPANKDSMLKTRTAKDSDPSEKPTRTPQASGPFSGVGPLRPLRTGSS